MAQPLRELAKAENFEWTKSHTRSFVALKDELCNKVLKAFDPHKDVVYAVKRLHKHLYGRKFRIITDHKPLEYLLKQNGCKSAHVSQRVNRWSIFLSNYEYDLEGKRTNLIPVADLLSRVELHTDENTFDVGAADIFFEPDNNLKNEILKSFEVSKQFSQNLNPSQT